MRGETPLIDRETCQPYLVLVLFSGVAVILSIPTARTVMGFGTFSLLSGIPIFFYVHILFTGILGLSVGAASAQRYEAGATLISRQLVRVLLAQILMLPYFVFQWALHPNRGIALVLILTYVTLFGWLCAVAAHLIERPRGPSGSYGFLLKYALFGIYTFATLGLHRVLSPIGMTISLLEGDGWSEYSLGFAVPAVLLALISLPILRQKVRVQRV